MNNNRYDGNCGTCKYAVTTYDGYLECTHASHLGCVYHYCRCKNYERKTDSDR